MGEGERLSCVGAVGQVCIQEPGSFVLVALPSEEGEPTICAMPVCDVHGAQILDWAAAASPLGYASRIEIAGLPDVQAWMAEEGGEIEIINYVAA